MVDIKTVGVIGAGQMGSGIAHVSALAGYDVVVSDVTIERVESALATINGHMARQIAKGMITDVDRKAALKRITAAKSLEAMGNCDIVIEAAAENEPLKRQIFESLKPHLKPDAVVGSNTSSISITRLAAITGNPERFIGIHFMNPVPVMQLVELIRGIATERRDLRGGARILRQARQDGDGGRGFSGLHRQSHPPADDQ